MLVLKTLSIGVMHGYGIAQHIRQVSGDVLHVEEGSLYPALQRLQLQGLVASEWGHSANNRKAAVLPADPRRTPRARRSRIELRSADRRDPARDETRVANHQVPLSV